MKIPAALFLCSFLFLFCAVLRAETLEQQFQTAPMILPDSNIPLKGIPLWHTNGPLTDELIHDFFENGAKNGFGGYTFLPLGRNVPTEPHYLTDGYFAYFGKILNEAKTRGQKIIFYDDVDFPSGTAGGKMYEKFSDDCTKRLDEEAWDVTGPKENAEFRFSQPRNSDWTHGKIQAAAAMNLRTFERVDLSDFVKKTGSSESANVFQEECDRILWNVPEGDWKVMVFYAVSDGNKVDNMDPDAMRKFISLTYEAFYERFPEHFGTTIPISFFDDVTLTQTQGGRNWTPWFNRKYEALYGHSPTLDYPAIFHSMGPETAAARVRIWTTRNELFADGYAKTVHEWCTAHKIMSSGHPQGPYTIQPNNMCGDEMLTHRDSDAPLFDSIHYYGHGRDGFKVPTSAAYNFDKPLCLVEIYGNYRDGERNGKPEFDDQMLFKSAMEIFCRGGNVLLPHGIWTNPEKMYIPPEISWRNPNLKEILPAYGEWVSRICLILRNSRHVADIGIVYPIDNLKAFYFFHKNFPKGEYPYGIYIPAETDYMAVGSDLTSRIYRDFTYLHPDTMSKRCKIVQNSEGAAKFRLDNQKNWEEYEVLILTGSEVISVQILSEVFDFYQKGGKILATTRLPSRAAEGGAENDAKICTMIQTMFGVDPRVQGTVEAEKCGQEDIVLPEHFRDFRTENAYGQYTMNYEGISIQRVPKIIQNRAIFLPDPTPEELQTSLDAFCAVPDVKIQSHNGEELPTVKTAPRWGSNYDGMVQYIHKVKDGRDFYLIANSSDVPVSLDVQLRGRFKTLEIWDPRDGSIRTVPAEMLESRDGCVCVKGLELSAIQALFLVGKQE